MFDIIDCVTCKTGIHLNMETRAVQDHGRNVYELKCAKCSKTTRGQPSIGDAIRYWNELNNAERHYQMLSAAQRLQVDNERLVYQLNVSKYAAYFMRAIVLTLEEDLEHFRQWDGSEDEGELQSRLWTMINQSLIGQKEYVKIAAYAMMLWLEERPQCLTESASATNGARH